jgi:hypothetical protein
MKELAYLIFLSALFYIAANALAVGVMSLAH